MASYGFALFETDIGMCAVGWGDQGLVSVQLPASTVDALRARMRRFVPGAVEGSPPESVRQAIAGIQALLRGEEIDLGWIHLDDSAIPAFNRQVYAIARAIPRGQTMTYGEIARRLGNDPLLAQAVGKAMGQNPHPIVMPCHRVMAAGGKFGGFSAHGGVETKRRLLTIEGVFRDEQPSLFG